MLRARFLRMCLVPAVAALAIATAVTTTPGQASGFESGRETGPVPTSVRDAADTAGAFDLTFARVQQINTTVVWRVITRRPWSTRILQHHANRDICLGMIPSQTGSLQRRVCIKFDPKSRSRLRTVLQYVRATGAIVSTKPLASTISRPSTSSVAVTMSIDAMSLKPGVVDWTTTSRYTDDNACLAGCEDTAPDAGVAGVRIWRTHVNGCMPTSPWLRLNLRTTEKVVALTFDDGPTDTTQGFISTLHKMHVPATFFVIGKQARANPSIVRRELAHGNVVGNHSFTHRYMTEDSSTARAELTRTNSVIRTATGYTPCLYRSPYGARGAGILRLATRLHMDTILWDVDPRDWSHPPSSEIRDHVLSHVHPGAIVLMHDGAAGRRATLAALPSIIRTLRSRGYRMVTIPELFHMSPTYAYTKR